MRKPGNGRILYALYDPRFEQGRIFFGEQHDSSDATIWTGLYSECAQECRVCMSGRCCEVGGWDFFGSRRRPGSCVVTS